MVKKVVAICACPAGVAHTYIVADRFEAAVKSLGCQVKVETQGMAGIENKLTEKDLNDADLIVMANDIAIVEPERFAGYQDKIVQSNMHEALHHGKEIVTKYFENRGGNGE